MLAASAVAGEAAPKPPEAPPVDSTGAAPVKPEPPASPKKKTTFLDIARKSLKELEVEKIFLDEIMAVFASNEYNNLDMKKYRREIARYVTDLQLKLCALAEEKKEKAEGLPTLEERIRLTYKYLFSDLAFMYREDYKDLALISLNKIIKNREGNSLGLGLLVLAVIERLSEYKLLPDLAGAWTGDHFVLTYKVRLENRFLEPDERGLDRTAKSYGVPKAAVDSGAYLTRLDKEQLVGLLCYVRGKLFFEEKKLIPAEAYLKLATERHPKLLEAHLLLAKVLLARMENDAYRSARIELDAVCRLNPRHAHAFFMRGLAYFNTSDPARAKEDFKTALKLEGGEVRAHYYLARIAHDAGEIKAAHAGYKKFLDESTKEHRNLRLKARYAMREIEAAGPIKTLLDAAASYENRIKAAMTLGRLKVRIGYAPLIEALSDKNIRFRHLCAKILTELTGKKLGTDQEKWRMWLKERE
jgi:regulator of sirC expression with transglutaminase-like and TPR domain